MKDFIVVACATVTFLVAGCESTDPTEAVEQDEVAGVATAFFETYSERSDWNKLLSFYSKDMQFEDVLLQLKLEGLDEFKKFYDWPNPEFKKMSPDQNHLVVETLATSGNRVAVARGHLNPFMWKGEQVDSAWGMEFTIWLFFDDELKIVRQIDWMEYDDRVLENVIKRIRKDGLDSKPPGL